MIEEPDQYFRGYRGPLWIRFWWLERHELEFLVERREQRREEKTEQTYQQKKPPPPPPPPKAAPVTLTTANPLYRRLMAKYHPDHSPQTAEVAKDFNQLWQAVNHDIRGKSR